MTRRSLLGCFHNYRQPLLYCPGVSIPCLSSPILVHKQDDSAWTPSSRWRDIAYSDFRDIAVENRWLRLDRYVES